LQLNKDEIDNDIIIETLDSSKAKQNVYSNIAEQ